MSSTSAKFLWISLLSLGLILVSLSTSAQISQIGRYETTISGERNEVKLIPIGEKGLFLLNEVPGNYNRRELWRISRIDTSLNEVWSGVVAIDNLLQISKTDTLNGSAYVLFNNYRGSKSTLILKINANGTYTQIPFQNLVPMRITEFKVIDQGKKLLIGGYFNYRPIVVIYDVLSNRPKILPGLFNEPGDILQLTRNLKTRTIDLVIKSDGRQTRGIWVKSYNFDGDVLKNVFVQNDQKKASLINTRVVPIENGDHLLVGTYGIRGSEYSRGIFFGILDDSKLTKSRIINFSELPNFFDYAPPRRQARIKERIARKIEKGKTPRFTYKVRIQDIREQDGEFAMIGEAHYVKYNSTNYRGAQLAFDGFIFTHAFLVGFDMSGIVQWDQSIRTKDIKKYDLDQLVHFTMSKDAGVLMYPSKNMIKYTSFEKAFNGNSQEDEIEISLLHPNDYVRFRDSNTSDINYWYNDYYFVHGKHNIKNMSDDNVPLNRKVYFVNKIQYSKDGEPN